MQVTLWLFANDTASGAVPRPARLAAPATLTYPLLSCHLRAVTRGPNFRRYLERPRALRFSEAGLPAPAGDVTLTLVARCAAAARARWCEMT